MSNSASSETVEIENETITVGVPPETDEEFEMFPEERADGPLSAAFRTAQRFKARMESE